MPPIKQQAAGGRRLVEVEGVDDNTAYLDDEAIIQIFLENPQLQEKLAEHINKTLGIEDKSDQTDSFNLLSFTRGSEKISVRKDSLLFILQKNEEAERERKDKQPETDTFVLDNGASCKIPTDQIINSLANDPTFETFFATWGK